MNLVWVLNTLVINVSKGRMGGKQTSAGPSGECLCPKCGTRVPHQAGKPCYEIDCPKCKTKYGKMIK